MAIRMLFRLQRCFSQINAKATQGLFMYKDKPHKQLDDVTMGSCLGPTSAKFFLGCLEEKLFANTNNLSLNLFFLYINDTYLCCFW